MFISVTKIYYKHLHRWWRKNFGLRRYTRRKMIPPRWVMNLITAVPVALVFGFGLSFLQSDGQSVLGNTFRSEIFNNFSISGSFSVLPAEAQTTFGCGDPSAPAAGSGAIYYNAGCSKFRMYANSSWQDLGGSNFDQQVIVDTSTLVDADPRLYPGSKARDALILNVPTSSNDLAGLVTNVGMFGLWSNSLNNWAGLTLGKICFDSDSDLVSPDCRTGWQSDSLWVSDTSDPRIGIISNQNKYSATSAPSLGGDVKVTRQLIVDGSITLTGNNTATSDWEQEDWDSITSPQATSCSTVPCKFGGVLNNVQSGVPTWTDNGALYVSHDNKFKVAVGNQGAAIISLSSLTWKQAVVANSSAGKFTTVWGFLNSTNQPYIYSIDPNVAGKVRVLNPNSGTWNNAKLTSNSNDYNNNNIDAGAKILGLNMGSNYRLIVATNNNTQLILMDLDNNGKFTSGGGPYGASFSTTLVDISGSTSGYIYITGSTKTTIRKNFGGTGATQYNHSDNGFIIPKAISVNYNSDECSYCIVLVGSQGVDTDGANTGKSSTNIIVGNRSRSGTSDTWNWQTINPSVSGTSYNSASYHFYDVWVGANGQTILISGADSSSNRFLLLTSNGGAEWERVDLPQACDSSGQNCVIDTAIAPLLGGADTIEYALQRSDQNLKLLSFWKGLASKPGSLTVQGGDIVADGNKWGTNSWLQNTTGTPLICTSDRFIAGLKINSSGQVVDIFCSKL